MEAAYEQLLGQGILGVFLVLVIVYHLKTVKDLKQEMKEANQVHAEQIAAKDKMIEEKNDKIHELGINAVTAVKDFTNAIKGI